MVLRKLKRKSKNVPEKDREKEQEWSLEIERKTSEWYKEGGRMVLRKKERKSKNVLEEDREKD